MGVVVLYWVCYEATYRLHIPVFPILTDLTELTLRINKYSVDYRIEINQNTNDSPTVYNEHK